MPAAEKISITLTPEMNRLNKRRVDAGDFASSSELIREALRVWRQREDEQRERIAAIKQRIRRSIDDPRPSLTLAEAKAELARRRRARDNARKR
jgi:antitoxin ParD1/3/4